MNLTEMSLDKLIELLSGFPKFRAKQVYEWISKGYRVNEMSNVPKDIKAVLNTVPFGGVEIMNIDAPFKTVVKYLCRLEDDNVVECVLMNYKHGNSLCISSQVGCSMGCAFCASTIDGCVRNMTSGEMYFTVALLNRLFSSGDKRGVTNIVIMGSGEPLINFNNTVKFIEDVRDRLGISPRNITVSTCGITENMIALADLNLGCNLALSLHAPNDAIRAKLMPIAEKYSVKVSVNALSYYFNKTGRRVLIEYILIKDINDDKNCVVQLSNLLRGLNCHVNVIPYNTVSEREFKAPSKAHAEHFVNELCTAGISATLRRELGDNIDAACGQLRRKYMKNEVIK